MPTYSKVVSAAAKARSNQVLTLHLRPECVRLHLDQLTERPELLGLTERF